MPLSLLKIFPVICYFANFCIIFAVSINIFKLIMISKQVKIGL